MISTTRPYMSVSRIAAATMIAASVALLAVGCESAEQRHAHRLMWYRAPEKAPLPPTSFGVGRYGRVAEYGTWYGFDVSGNGTEIGGASAGRVGGTASYSTWGPNDVGGDPTGGSATYGQIPGSTTNSSVAGHTATVGELGEGAASYGRTP